jgi:hypothetical protein
MRWAGQVARSSCWEKQRNYLPRHVGDLDDAPTTRRETGYCICTRPCAVPCRTAAWSVDWPREAHFLTAAFSRSAPPSLDFVSGYLQDQVHVPPSQAALEKLKVMIRNAGGSVHRELTSVWQETDCRFDVSRATVGGERTLDSISVTTLWRSAVAVHVDGARLCLWTAATNGPAVHLLDIWVWTALVEWY